MELQNETALNLPTQQSPTLVSTTNSRNLGGYVPLNNEGSSKQRRLNTMDQMNRRNNGLGTENSFNKYAPSSNTRNLGGYTPLNNEGSMTQRNLNTMNQMNIRNNSLGAENSMRKSTTYDPNDPTTWFGDILQDDSQQLGNTQSKTEPRAYSSDNYTTWFDDIA